MKVGLGQSGAPVSISRVTAPTTQDVGKIVSASIELDSGENWRYKASGLVLRELGRYEMKKLNRLKNSCHLACQEFNCLAR